MRCSCGESVKCIRRHPANPERDEYLCDACKRIFLRYDIDKVTFSCFYEPDQETLSRFELLEHRLPKHRQHRPGASPIVGVAAVVAVIVTRWLLWWLGLWK